MTSDDAAARAATRRWLAGTATALVLLTTAVGLRWSSLVRLDHAVAASAFAMTSGHVVRTHVWLLVSAWGGPDVVRAVMLLVSVVAAVRRRPAWSLWLLALGVLEATVAPASKLLLARPRPTWAHPITVVGSTSYPSGHAAAAFTAATAAVLMVSGTRRRVPRLVVTGVVVALAALVAASRVLLGVHYLSDVVGGALLGAVLALTTWLVMLRLSRPPSTGGLRSEVAAARGRDDVR